MSKKKITALDYKKLYQELFNTDNGKLVLMDLCNRFHMMGSIKKKSDVIGDMDFREGQRSVALYILAQVKYDLNKFFEDREDYQLEVTHDR